MIYVRIIDENGLFIEDSFVEEITKFTIETPCPGGFYLPKWNGEQWVEGMAQEDIDAIRNQPQPKSELELLQEQNEKLKIEMAEAKQIASETSLTQQELIELLIEMGVM